jgi:hypothetical protein
MYLKSIKTRLHSLLRFAFEQHFENLIINCRESFKYLKKKNKIHRTLDGPHSSQGGVER